MLPVLRRTLRWALKVLRHNKRVFVLTFIQRSAQHSLTALSDELAKLNPRVAFAQTYPDEIQGAFDRASDALHAALMAARDNGFWVGIGIGELNIPRFAGALGAVSTTDCTGDALEFSRLAIEEAQGGAPVRCISISADNHHLAELATGSARLLYRVCADRTTRHSASVRCARPAEGRRNRPGNHHPGGQPHPRPFPLARRAGRPRCAHRADDPHRAHAPPRRLSLGMPARPNTRCRRIPRIPSRHDGSRPGGILYFRAILRAILQTRRTAPAGKTAEKVN